MRCYQNVMQMIGQTPMLQVSRLDRGCCELFLKLENLNPGGSIKDRIALYMLNEAETSGQLHSGDTIIEATAGNTGLGLALLAALRGYNLIVVMPDKMCQDKMLNLKAMGAELVVTRSDVNKGHPEYYQDLAKKMAEENNYFYIDQFNNKDNVKAHFETTGPEIWQQMEGNIDAFVCGVGTGGTLTGAGGYLKGKNPNIDLVLADPEGSVLAPYIKTQKFCEPGSWLVEGIGEDFIPDICELSLANHAYSISDKESFFTAYELLKNEGIMGGSSTGTLVAAALRYCKEQQNAKRVVTLVCDTGTRYLSKLYSDQWLEQQGINLGI